MLKKIIIILSLIILLSVVWMVYSKFFSSHNMSSTVKIEYQEIDPGRLVLGKKISIRDGVKIPIKKYVVISGSTPTILGNIDLGTADNLYREVSETIYIEEGYFTDQIISTERYDTLVEGELQGSLLRIKLPLPDTIQCFGINAREKNFAPFFIGFLPSRDVQSQLDTIKMAFKEEGYSKWKTEWQKSLTENLEYTAKSLSNFLNESARISQSPKFTTITSVFEFEQEGQNFEIEIQCNQNGNCYTSKREIKAPILN